MDRPNFYITWTPSPSVLDYYDPIRQFQQTWPVLKHATSCWETWALTPELNSNGNIHFHGHFSLNPDIASQSKWFRRSLPCLKRKGFIKINKVKHCLEETYMLKDTFLMQEILGIKLPLRSVILEKHKRKGFEQICQDLMPAHYDPDIDKWVHEVEPGAEAELFSASDQ